MNFTKMNGIGNDYIFIDGTKKEIYLTSKRISALCNRNFGIGGDGIVIVGKSTKADLGMRIYNADGSEAEMCGNALRCLVKFAITTGLINRTNLTVETLAGLRHSELNDDGTVSANMGKPVVSTHTIRVEREKGYIVNVGNPHFVVFKREIKSNFSEKAKKISDRYDIFPEGTNVEFAVIENTNQAFIRVWERGSNETHACGTGATAVFETGYMLGLLHDNSIMRLKGGELVLRHNTEGEVIVTGKAEINFIGQTDD